jgi:hypothetical protein
MAKLVVPFFIELIRLRRTTMADKGLYQQTPVSQQKALSRK